MGSGILDMISSVWHDDFMQVRVIRKTKMVCGF